MNVSTGSASMAPLISPSSMLPSSSPASSTSIFVARITPPSPRVPLTSTFAPTTSGPSSCSIFVAALLCTALPPITQSPTKPPTGIASTIPSNWVVAAPGGGGGGGVPDADSTSIFVATSTPPSPGVPFASTVAPTTSGPSSWSMIVSAVLCTALPPIVQSPTKPLAGIDVTVPLTSTTPSLAAANVANVNVASAANARTACFRVVRMVISRSRPGRRAPVRSRQLPSPCAENTPRVRNIPTHIMTMSNRLSAVPDEPIPDEAGQAQAFRPVPG